MAQITDSQRQTLEAEGWFASLPVQVREAIVLSGHVVVLPQGRHLFCRGDPGDGWYALLEGSLHISGTSRDGRAAMLTVLQPGAWFGEMSLLDGLPRTHDVVAGVEARLLKVPCAEFELLLSRWHELSRALLTLKCQHHRMLMAIFESSIMQPLEQRLAERLLMLAKSLGTPMSGVCGVELHLSQELMSQLVGSSRARVSQVLKVWKAQRLMEHRYGRVVLLDLERLEALCEH